MEIRNGNGPWDKGCRKEALLDKNGLICMLEVEIRSGGSYRE